MAEQITVTGVRPRQMVYKQSTYTFTSKAWDNDLNTYDANSNGAGIRPTTLLLDLSAIPKKAVIKKVTYRLYLYRSDNASYCGLQTALGYADSLTNDLNAQHRVTEYKDLSLTDYKVKQETTGSQTITSTQSKQILQAKYPILWMNGYGSMRYYEISLDVTYEIPQGEIYVGEDKAAKVYVGAKEAAAVYIGTAKVL